MGSTPTVVANSFLASAQLRLPFFLRPSLPCRCGPDNLLSQGVQQLSVGGDTAAPGTLDRSAVRSFPSKPTHLSRLHFMFGSFLSPDRTALACLLVLTCIREQNPFRRFALANAHVEPVNPPSPNGLASWTDPSFLFEARG